MMSTAHLAPIAQIAGAESTITHLDGRHPLSSTMNPATTSTASRPSPTSSGPSNGPPPLSQSFRLALHLQKRLASSAWLILVCFSNIQFAPPKGAFSGCNGGISTDAKAKLDSGFSSRVFPLGPICITTTIFYKYYIMFLRNKYYI